MTADLLLNRWAESLDLRQMSMLFPKVSKSELPYAWNRLTYSERVKLFNKFVDVFKDKAVVSSVPTAKKDSRDEIKHTVYKTTRTRKTRKNNGTKSVSKAGNDNLHGK